MEALSIVMGLLRVVRNRAIKKMLIIEKHEKIAMLAVSTLKNIISNALSENSISDEEYSLTLMEFETITRMKEDLRIKSKTNLEKTGNTETEASVLINGKTSTTPTRTHVQSHVQKPCSKPC